MQTLTLKVPSELAEWLEKRARELNRPKSEIVRRALLAQRDDERFPSLLDRAGGLVGKYASSRKDSSHKRHLKGMGLCRRPC
jgi:Ribbon-helix-helix protein, copG family